MNFGGQSQKSSGAPRYLGKVVTVRSCFGGYRLPPGLPELSRVMIVGQQSGYFEVQWEGQAFTVAMSCVEGLEKVAG
jgi:hypothetical protein